MDMFLGIKAKRSMVQVVVQIQTHYFLQPFEPTTRRYTAAIRIYPEEVIQL